MCNKKLGEIFMTGSVKFDESKVCSYTVKAGDNLETIAKRNGTTVEALLKFNPELSRNQTLYPGQGVQLNNYLNDYNDLKALEQQRHDRIIAESRATIDKAVDYGYDKEYDFDVAPNGDIILILKEKKTFGEIRGDFQIEEGSLSRTNNIKGKNSKYEAPPLERSFPSFIRKRNYDDIEVPEGDRIVVERLKFNPNPSKTKLGRTIDFMVNGYSNPKL